MEEWWKKRKDILPYVNGQKIIEIHCINLLIKIWRVLFVQGISLVQSFLNIGKSEDASKVGKKKSRIQPTPFKIEGQESEVKPKQKPKHRLIQSRPKNFGIGQAIQPKRDLTRYVKWPKYVRIQRQEKKLRQRLKAPPAINQFNVTADPKITSTLIRFAKKYRPETKKAKTLRLLNAAHSKLQQDSSQSSLPTDKKPFVIKHGLNHVTTLIERKKAQLVLIARDVYPLELIVWLPALCRKMGIPYVIVKSKAVLGSLVHQKTATCICFTRIRPEDQNKLNLILKSIDETFTKTIDITRKKWSTPRLSAKSRSRIAAQQKAVAVAST